MFAVITTGVVAATDEVVMVKFTLLDPAGTVTDTGTCATPVFALETGTTTPPAGATLASSTVPVELSPPPTVEGESDSPDDLPGVTVMKAELLVTPPRPSATWTLTVTRVLAVTAGGVKTADGPLPASEPASADQV